MAEESAGAVASAEETASPLRERSEPLPRTFGLKDVFTCINVLGGIFAIIFCIKGNPRYAAYAFLLGYLLGDALDGLVARLTRTGNLFGKEFDSISDHLAQCIAPAFIVFICYRDTAMPAWVTNIAGPNAAFFLAAALASVLIIAGSVRHARMSVASVNFDMAYMGLPRTASAFVIVSFLNSTLFIQVPGGKWVGVVLLVGLSVLHLVPLPFRTHRGRKLKFYVKMLVLGFFTTTVASLLFFRDFVFDVTFFWLAGYMGTSWIPMEPEERRAFFTRAREWALEVRRAR
jgi:CDP-diacylglycerol--serine O-phosphatidyltransferase